MADEEGQIVEPNVDTLDLVCSFVRAGRLHLHALQRQVAREEIQVDVVQQQDAVCELGDLSDRDAAHDLGQNRQEQPTEHHHRHEDADQDLARAAGDAEHQTSTPLRASAGGAPAPRRPAARTTYTRASTGGAPAPRRSAARTAEISSSAGSPRPSCSR